MNIREVAKFRAVTGASEGFGTTPQEALSALMESLTGDAPTPIVILPFNRGDAFFTDAQHARLRQLKSCRRKLTPEERVELETLVAASFDATIARTHFIPMLKK